MNLGLLFSQVSEWPAIISARDWCPISRYIFRVQANFIIKTVSYTIISKVDVVGATPNRWQLTSGLPGCSRSRVQILTRRAAGTEECGKSRYAN